MSKELDADYVGALLSGAIDQNGVTTASRELQEYANAAPNIRKPFLIYVFQHACENPTPEIRQLAFVFLRTRLRGLWTLLSNTEEQEMWNTLLKRIEQETDPGVMTSLSHAVASVAVIAFPQWGTALFRFVSDELCCSGKKLARVAGYNIFSSLIGMMDAPATSLVLELAPKIETALGDEELDVAKSAIQLVLAIATHSDVSQGFTGWSSLMNPVLNTCMKGVKCDREDVVQISLETLNEVMEGTDWVTEESIRTISMSLLSEIGLNKALPAGIREQAFHFVHCAAEKNPGVFTKDHNLLEGIIRALITIACDPAEDAAFDFESEDEMTPFRMSCQAIDSLALTIPSPKLFPNIYPSLIAKIRSRDILDRRCGLVFLGILSEGCESFLRKRLNEFINFYFQALTDDSEIIRAAGGLGIGQMAEFLQPEILRYTDTALAYCIPTLESCLETRAQCTDSETLSRIDYVLDKVCYTLELFCSGCSESIMTQHQPGLVPKLVQCLRMNPSPSAKTSCFAALSGIVVASKASFQPYLRETLELLAQVLNSENGDDVAKAIHLAGSLVAALDSPHLVTERTELIHSVSSILAKEFAADGSQISHEDETKGTTLKECCYGFFVRLAYGARDAISQVLPGVATCAFATIAAGDGITRDCNEQFSDTELEDPAEFTVHTGIIDELIAALNLLVAAFAVCEPQVMVPYVQQTLETISMLHTHFIPQTRAVIIGLCQALTISLMKLNSPDWWKTQHHPTFDQEDGSWTASAKRGWIPGFPAKSPLKDTVTRVWSTQLWSVFSHGLMNDTDAAVVTEAAAGLAEMILVCGPGLFSTTDGEAHGESLSLVQNTLESVLSNSHPCQSLYSVKWENDTDFRQREENLFEGMMNLLSATAEAVGTQAAQLFDHFHPLISKLIQHPTSPAIRCMGIGCYSDILRIVRHWEQGPHLLKITAYISSIFPLLADGISQAESDSLCQNAAFCAGMCIEACPSSQEVLKELPKLISSAHIALQRYSVEQLVSSEASALDNVLSMIARILIFVVEVRSSTGTVSQWISLLANHLPLRQDFGESEPIAKLIIDCVMSGTFTPNITTVWVDLAQCCVLLLADSNCAPVLAQCSSDAENLPSLKQALHGALLGLFRHIGHDLNQEVLNFPLSQGLSEHVLIRELVGRDKIRGHSAARSFLQSCFE
eukprot:Gregarina_sp_Poly_1__4181@NODE_228_length_11160_cov_127_571532_g202_i0_p1_GENE_NODE_228_length_11160_cov_127_571532_g202_i0NODE_228_length_11160_cov_127_571532_g202_i0_p1_ORF_typecomplete_len1179_score172_25Vac14_Fab1_bd/PF12755_7/6_5e03Vac14_Fab1_bd/PF12755_7/0_59Vac14_Fab1_bd/PF12755_7/4_7Vac14_Fab1_bd/PF12755_7/1_2e04Vac14_Fab1_bd/PF12755_7/3_7HEAT_EZ/PF13513_6/0_13HEAT_EZ/PF13513_6/0_36HEAT_EZ/PF13513_6/74HEAT_EZ/PF13513_6/9_9e03HEAT_EZ/PF13513_6/39HEAT_EZ/PF13513_6/1_1e04HEAT_EZ/PF13513_6/1